MIASGQQNMPSSRDEDNFAAYGIDKILGNIENGVDPIVAAKKNK